MTVKPPDESGYRVIGGALLLLRQLPCLTGLPVADPGGGGGGGGGGWLGYTPSRKLRN